VAAVEIPVIASQPELARHQHGAFTRQQAREAGFHPRVQRDFLAAGEWVCVLGRVMRHRDVPAGEWLRARAAALASGRARIVSHSTAARLWGWDVVDPRFHVIRTDGLTEPGLTHHRLEITDDEVVDLGGWQITTPLRTIADLLCWDGARTSVTWISEAFRKDRLQPEALLSATADLGRRKGARRARFVAHTCQGRPFSVLEWDFHQIARTVDAAGWRFNEPLHDASGVVGIIDAINRRSRLAVEVDGRRFHGDDRFQADRSRDQRLVALGFTVVRFTWDDVRGNPDMVRRILRSALSGKRNR
jgi:hypothetical protein